MAKPYKRSLEDPRYLSRYRQTPVPKRWRRNWASVPSLDASCELDGIFGRGWGPGAPLEVNHVSVPTMTRVSAAAVSGRCGAVLYAEYLDEVAGGAVADRFGDLGDRQIRFNQESPGPLQASPLKLGVRCAADKILEPDLDVAAWNLELADHVVDANWLGRMVVDNGQCGCDLRVVDGDHVGGTPGDEVQRFGDQHQTMWKPLGVENGMSRIRMPPACELLI